MHACLCLCGFRQRGQHVDACLLVFVLHACLCLCSGLLHALPFPISVPLPMCSLHLPPVLPCMFPLSCPARARMPGILLLCLALLAHAGPAVGPSLPFLLLHSCRAHICLVYILHLPCLYIIIYYSWNGGRAEAVCAGGKEFRRLVLGWAILGPPTGARFWGAGLLRGQLGLSTPTLGHLRNAPCSLQGFQPGALELVEAGPRVLPPDRFPFLGGCRLRGSPRLWEVTCIVS